MKFIVMAKNTRVNRKQIGITSGFVYTKYKTQKVIFKSTVLDLWRKSKKIVGEYHKYFCLIYIQLSRLQSLERLSILEPIRLDDINNQPYPNP